MALNPDTLYHLYEKGILEYIPTDLIGTAPIASMMPMSNPYLDMAKQGGLYQNHGAYSDSFQMTGVQSPYVQNYQTYGNISGSPVQIGSNSNVGGWNTFNGYGVGRDNSNTTAGLFGFNNTVGVNSNAGGWNTFGFGNDNQNSIVNGYNKTMSVISRTPKMILGLAAGAIGILGLTAAFKRGKKPVQPNHKSFLSKLNPRNWFNKKN